MEIEVKDLTCGEIAGTGLFEELMRSTKSQLQHEFDEGRILGADYGVVYLGALQANLQTASTFILEYGMRNKQQLLLESQILGSEWDNKLKEDQLLTAAKQRDLLDEQIKVQANTALKILEETKLVAQKVLESEQQVKLLVEQVKQVTAQISLTGKQEDLVDGKILTEKAVTSLPVGGQSLANYNRTLAENAILTKKLATETAQTEGDPGSVRGLLGAEIMLKHLQGESFLRDAEQKAAKFYSDVLSIAYSVDTAGTDPALWGLGPVESNVVLAKLLEGINVSDPTP